MAASAASDGGAGGAAANAAGAVPRVAAISEAASSTAVRPGLRVVLRRRRGVTSATEGSLAGERGDRVARTLAGCNLFQQDAETVSRRENTLLVPVPDPRLRRPIGAA
ncbi:hypothetical protein GCM10010505_71130 [Kitasatospora aburaviensis]